MKLNQYTKLVSFLIVLSFSLYSYYFYSIGVPIVQLIGLMMLIIFIRNINTNYILFLPLLLYVSGIYLLSIFLVDDISKPTALIGFILCIFIFIFFSTLNSQMNVFFQKAIELLTITLLLFWYLQFATYYVLDVRLDFFNSIVGYPQRTTFAIFGQGFFRPSGLFVEPAMYSNAMFLIFVYRTYVNKKIFDIKNSLILFSIVFTMSLYGFIVFSFFILVFLINRISLKNIIILVIILIIGIVLMYYFNEQPIIKRILNPLSNQSGQERLIGNIFSFFNENIYVQMFGFGIGNAEVNAYSGNGLHFILYNFGYIGLLFFFTTILMYTLKIDKTIIFILIFILSILNNSSSITSFFNWMMLGLVIKSFSLRHKIKDHIILKKEIND